MTLRGLSHSTLPPVDSAFTIEEATIASVHRAYGAGSLTCVELVADYLGRIAAYDQTGPCLNAIVTVNPQALDLASAADTQRRTAPKTLGPLHGIPLVLKDNFDTADMRTTGASLALRDARPLQDAFTVQRLREAGALILAKTNMHELAMGGTSVGSLQGQVRNPYDLTRTPGGSSGGTGAAVAANLALAGMGTDTGQSIRSPASANSLVGLRPTRGLISRAGIIPTSATQDAAGPMARTVEDVARLLDVMAGYDPADPVTAASVGHIPPSYTNFLHPDGLNGRRIGVLRSFFGTAEVHAVVNEAMAVGLAAISGLGAVIVPFDIPGLAELTTSMATSHWEMKPLLTAYLRGLGAHAPVADMAALIATGQIEPDVLERLRACDQADERTPAYAEIFLRRDRLRQALLFAMVEHRIDAIVYPHQMRLVARIGEAQIERNGVLSNGTGFPAITVPCGFSPPDATAPLGVPVGMELLGREWNEGPLLAMAFAFEQGTLFRRPPLAAPCLRCRG